MTADEEANTANSSAFQLRCSGLLNGRGFKLNADGGPLINVDPNKPYSFTVNLSAGDIALALQVSIAQPFDLAAYDAKFDLSGSDLADAYYLTKPRLAEHRQVSRGRQPAPRGRRIPGQ